MSGPFLFEGECGDQVRVGRAGLSISVMCCFHWRVGLNGFPVAGTDQITSSIAKALSDHGVGRPFLQVNTVGQAQTKHVGAPGDRKSVV